VGDVNVDGSHFYFSCETSLYWNDLGFAELVEGRFSQNLEDNPEIPMESLPEHLPHAVLGSNYIAAFGDSSGFALQESICPKGVCFSITNIKRISIDNSYVTHPAVTPWQAYSIDSKVDDALMRSGSVQSWSPWGYTIAQIQGIDYTSINGMNPWPDPGAETGYGPLLRSSDANVVRLWLSFTPK
jgi:hypothetical protein